MSALALAPVTHFEAPDRLIAQAPAEERGLPRDGVRLLVATDTAVTHAHFRDLPAYLRAGDLVVVNNSATLAAQVDGTRADRGPVVVHAATRLDAMSWVVEVRTAPDAARAVLDLRPGEVVELADGLRLDLVAPYPNAGSSPTGRGNRLWRVRVVGPHLLEEHLRRYGRPIAYGYLDHRYPLAAYQTVFATRPGSAEMPSAARPFTPELVTRLVAAGVGVTAVTLHTGCRRRKPARRLRPSGSRCLGPRRSWSPQRARGVAGSWPSAPRSRGRWSRPRGRTARFSRSGGGPSGWSVALLRPGSSTAW